MKRIALILTVAGALTAQAGCKFGRAQEVTETLGGAHAMNEAQLKAAEMLALAEADYYEIDRARLRAMQTGISALFAGGPPRPGMPPPVAAADGALLAIGAPSRIDVTERSSLPVLIAARYRGLRAWETSYDQNTWIVTVDLDSGLVTNGQPFIHGKREMQTVPSMSGPEPDGIESQSSLSSVRSIQLRDFCAVPWQASRLAVTVFYSDWISNTLHLELTGGAPPERPLPPVRPTDFLTVSRTAAPPGLAERGIAVSVPSSVGAEADVLIRGAISLPAAGMPVRQAPDGSLLLMASMLLLQKDSRALGRIDLALPAGLAGPEGPGQLVQTAFAFDARERLWEQKMAGEYQTFFVVGDRVSGPYPLRVEARATPEGPR
jgi:hypothetical protein